MKKMIAALAASILTMFTVFGSSASAQPLAGLVCTGNSEPVCVCPQGTHRAHPGQAISASNPCVANGAARHYPDVCVGGAVRNRRGGCDCPNVGVSARTERIEVLISTPARRERGLPPHGRAIDCYDRTATGTNPGSYNDVRLTAVEVDIRLLCTNPETHVTNCAAAAALIYGLRSASPGAVTINYGGNVLGIQAAFNMIVEKLGEFEVWRRNEVDPTLHRHEEAINGLRNDVDVLMTGSATVPDGPNSITFSFGAFGLLGLNTAGPTTGAGGLALGMYYRPGNAKLDLYLRCQLGWQYTGYSVGGSPYVSPSLGVSIYTGANRAETMIQLALTGEDLWDPAADPPEQLQADSIGYGFGAEVAASIPVGSPHFRLRLGLAIMFAERRYAQVGNHMEVLEGALFAPSVGFEGLLPGL